MKRLYGSFIVKCKVKLNGFLIFDEAVAERVYGQNYKIEDQFKILGLPDIYLKYTRFEEFSSDAAARRIYEHVFVKHPDEKKKIRGMVFNGRKDGRVIVAYNPEDVVPYAWARVIDNEKELEKVKWNKFAQVNIDVSKKQETIPFAKYLIKYLTKMGYKIYSSGARTSDRKMIKIIGDTISTVDVNMGWSVNGKVYSNVDKKLIKNFFYINEREGITPQNAMRLVINYIKEMEIFCANTQNNLQRNIDFAEKLMSLLIKFFH